MTFNKRQDAIHNLLIDLPHKQATDVVAAWIAESEANLLTLDKLVKKIQAEGYTTGSLYRPLEAPHSENVGHPIDKVSDAS